MTRVFLLAAALLVTGNVTWAAGPNDGPKYSVMHSNKHYKDQRIMDHNNGAPRYPVMHSNKHYTDQRIMDHNNAAPRYPVVSATSSRANQGALVNQNTRTRRTVSAHTTRLHLLRSAHASTALAHHG